MPACRSCNGTKSDLVFHPSPIIQLHLQLAAEKAASAQALATEVVSERKIAIALNVLERALDKGRLDEGVIQTLGEFMTRHRQPDLKGQPIRLTPLYELIAEHNGIRIVRGPYGLGAKPTIPNPHSSFSCSSCGSIAAWNGARCVICGGMDD